MPSVCLHVLYEAQLAHSFNIFCLLHLYSPYFCSLGIISRSCLTRPMPIWLYFIYWSIPVLSSWNTRSLSRVKKEASWPIILSTTGCTGVSCINCSSATCTTKLAIHYLCECLSRPQVYNCSQCTMVVTFWPIRSLYWRCINHLYTYLWGYGHFTWSCLLA